MLVAITILTIVMVYNCTPVSFLYPKLLYGNHLFKTGDVLLHYNPNKYLLRLIGIKIIHVSIIIVKNNIPYIISLEAKSYLKLFIIPLKEYLECCTQSIIIRLPITEDIPSSVSDSVFEEIEKLSNCMPKQKITVTLVKRSLLLPPLNDNIEISCVEMVFYILHRLNVINIPTLTNYIAPFMFQYVQKNSKPLFKDGIILQSAS